MPPLDTPGLILRVDGAIAEIQLDRPEKRNAIDRAMWRGIASLAAEVDARRDVRVLIVSGSGGSFAAGADIAEFEDVFADIASSGRYLDDMVAATSALAALPIPVIAAVEGYCVGAGVAIALACDLRWAAADARFAVTPAKLGLVYSLTDTRRLIAAVGVSATKDLLFSGRSLDATAALDLGLVDAVTPPDELRRAVHDRAEAYCAMSSVTLASAKQIVRLIGSGQTVEDEVSRRAFAEAPGQADFAEGLAAFRNRRAPRFPGRR